MARCQGALCATALFGCGAACGCVFPFLPVRSGVQCTESSINGWCWGGWGCLFHCSAGSSAAGAWRHVTHPSTVSLAVVQAAPTQALMAHQSFKEKKAKLASKKQDSVLEKYGNAAPEKPDADLLLPVSEAYVEYDRTCAPPSCHACHAAAIASVAWWSGTALVWLVAAAVPPAPRVRVTPPPLRRGAERQHTSWLSAVARAIRLQSQPTRSPCRCHPLTSLRHHPASGTRHACMHA